MCKNVKICMKMVYFFIFILKIFFHFLGQLTIKNVSSHTLYTVVYKTQYNYLMIDHTSITITKSQNYFLVLCMVVLIV